MCKAEKILKTIKIKSVANGEFMTADARSGARVFCRPGRPLLFHQQRNDDGTVLFQVVDRSLVDQQLFLCSRDGAGALKLHSSRRKASFNLIVDDGKNMLENATRPGMCILYKDSPCIREGIDQRDEAAQWIFEESEFILQPIFAFGHMCNDLKFVKETLDRGGNAIECDIEVQNPQERSRPYDFMVTHSQFAPSYGGGKTALKKYLSGLKKYMPRLAAVMFDCKQADGVDYSKYGNDLAEAIVETGICSHRCIISVPHPECRSVLSARSVLEHSFQRDVSMIDIQPYRKEPGKWLKIAEDMGCNWLGMGITNFAPLPTNLWLSPLKHSVENKRKHGKVCKVYFWTLDSSASIRKILQAGADGAICNISAMFHDGLPSVKVLVDRDLTRRMATASDSLTESCDFKEDSL